MSTTLPLIRVPEIAIYDGIIGAIKAIQLDYVAQSDKNNSFLYKLLENSGFQRYVFFEQAVQVFLVDNTNPRCLVVDLMFNMQRNGPPTIYITMPSESPGQNAIGNDEGYQDPIYFDDTSHSNVFTRRYKATYDIVITSDNTNEVLLIYHVIKALLVSLTITFNSKGLQNLVFTGADMTPYSELVPKTIFMRAIRLGLEYESSTLSFEKYKLPDPTTITFTGTPVDG